MAGWNRRTIPGATAMAFAASFDPNSIAMASTAFDQVLQHRDLSCTIAAGGFDVVLGNGSETIWIRDTDPPPSPLTITNCGGQVVSKPPPSAPSNPIAIGGYSRFIRLTGTGSLAHLYGIAAWSIHPEQNMIDISGGASDVALEYLEVRGNDSGGVAAQLTGGSGISYKTCPNCSTGEFTAANWALHHVDI